MSSETTQPQTKERAFAVWYPTVFVATPWLVAIVSALIAYDDYRRHAVTEKTVGPIAVAAVFALFGVLMTASYFSPHIAQMRRRSRKHLARRAPLITMACAGDERAFAKVERRAIRRLRFNFLLALLIAAGVLVYRFVSPRFSLWWLLTALLPLVLAAAFVLRDHVRARRSL